MVDYSQRLNPIKPIPAINVPKELNARLGSGLKLPLSIINNRWELLSGVDKVSQDIFVTLMTPIGRHMYQPDFGSELPFLLMEPYNQRVQAELIHATKRAMDIWIPTAKVLRCTVDLWPDNVVMILIEYVIKGTVSIQSVKIAITNSDDVQSPASDYTINGSRFFKV